MKFRCTDPDDELVEGQIYEGRRAGEWIILDGPIGIRFPDGGNWFARRFEEVKAPVLDLKKPLQTKDGRPVRFLGQLTSGEIVGAILNTSGNGDYEKPYMWTPDGKPAFVLTLWPGCYLMNVPQAPMVKKRIIAMQSNGNLVILKEGTKWEDRKKGKSQAKSSTLIAFWEITITEGEGMCSCEGVTPCKCGDTRTFHHPV